MTELTVEKVVITPEELALRWGYHTKTILNHIRDGDIPAFKLGTQWRINLDWVENKEREGTPQL